MIRKQSLLLIKNTISFSYQNLLICFKLYPPRSIFVKFEFHLKIYLVLIFFLYHLCNDILQKIDKDILLLLSSQMLIGKTLILSPSFPPTHTVRATFTAHGVPSKLILFNQIFILLVLNHIIFYIYLTY